MDEHLWLEGADSADLQTKEEAVPHPAPFHGQILSAIRRLLNQHGDRRLAGGRLLDPFVGVGTIAGVGRPWTLFGTEIEPEWSRQAQDRGVDVHTGDARRLPWPDGYFGAIVTSPALGNRLADSYAPDRSDPKHGMRRSYRIYLGRELTLGSGAAQHWGDEYRAIHAAVWRESVRVLEDGGVLILNCKDHMRKGLPQPVTEWHVRTLAGLGLEPLVAEAVRQTGDQNTNSMRKRGVQVIDHECVVALRKPLNPSSRLIPQQIDEWINQYMSGDDGAHDDDEPNILEILAE